MLTAQATGEMEALHQIVRDYMSEYDLGGREALYQQQMHPALIAVKSADAPSRSMK
ncbi:hypothetical protein [Paracoccus mutanolyticus]|uniref:hypothetical protein n=1 Tax=Paracoccus mutanolyticus TaxID=1499308 RepID=UPI001678B666|nr:hypothetical protein [Paracoccus mutanolyticus]